jgi:hypothetical protein
MKKRKPPTVRQVMKVADKIDDALGDVTSMEAVGYLCAALLAEISKASDEDRSVMMSIVTVVCNDLYNQADAFSLGVEQGESDQQIALRLRKAKEETWMGTHLSAVT